VRALLFVPLEILLERPGLSPRGAGSACLRSELVPEVEEDFRWAAAAARVFAVWFAACL